MRGEEFFRKAAPVHRDAVERLWVAYLLCDDERERKQIESVLELFCYKALNDDFRRDTANAAWRMAKEIPCMRFSRAMNGRISPSATAVGKKSTFQSSKPIERSKAMEIRQVVIVTEIQLFTNIMGRNIVRHEVWNWSDEEIIGRFKQLEQGVDKFRLKRNGIRAEDFMLMHAFRNCYTDVIAFKHRGTRNYIFILDAVGALLIPARPYVPFKHGEFYLYEITKNGGENHDR